MRTLHRSAAACLVAALALGCAGGKRGPVSGKVTLDNQALPVGSVTFYPDTAKGNSSTVSGSGIVSEQGQFTLQSSDGTPGLPLGWYKATVVTVMPMSNPTAKTAAPAINKSFNQPDTTPLSVEVVAAPAEGAYDLKVTR